MLKLSEKLEKINENLENEKSTKNTWYEVITERNKVLHFTSETRKTLEKEGLNLENIAYNYISYNDKPLSYNSLRKVLSENKDIFREKTA